MNLSRTMLTLVLLSALALWAQQPAERAPAKAGQGRFGAVDIFVDSGTEPLAAYQLEFSSAGSAKIVGIEGGESPAFSHPPYYDPQAMQGERAILAAFNTASADKLPKGKSRVATIHLQIGVEDVPKIRLKLHTAASGDGHPISVQISFTERNAQ